MTPFFAAVFKLTSLLFFFGAAKPTQCTMAKPQFFFLPPWWEFLPKAHLDELNQCVPNFNFPQDIWAVGFWGLDVLIRVAGFVAVIGVIIAGVTYMTTTGNPEKAASARKRLYNSLIGLAIALIATALVSFIGRKLGG